MSQRVESLVDMLAEQAIMTRPMVRFAAPGEQNSGLASSTTSELPALDEMDVVDDESAARARGEEMVLQQKAIIGSLTT